MKKSAIALLPLLAFGLGCDGDTANQEAIANRLGIWMGFVVDAKSGERLNFFNPTEGTTNDSDNNAATDQIWALVNGDIVSGQPCGTPGVDRDLGFQNGCFQVQNLPTAQSIPVFVTRDGYEFFQSTIYIEPLATLPDSDYDSTGFVFIDRPQYYGNVRLFPSGVNYDVTVHVTYDDRGIEGLTVRCIQDPEPDYFDVVGYWYDNYLDPEGDFAAVLNSEPTDANGNTTFAGADLVKGAEYTCFANWVDLVSGSTAYCDQCMSFTVGVDDPYQEIELSMSEPNLEAIWSNIDDSENPIGASGPVTIVLNRPAQVVAGTTDCQGGSVSAGTVNDGTPPALTADVDNDASESITVSLDSAGTTLTITPNFATAISNDRFVNFSFGGIFLQTTSGLRTDTIYRVGSPLGGLSLFTLSSPTTTPTNCTGMDGLATSLSNYTEGSQNTTGRLVN